MSKNSFTRSFSFAKSPAEVFNAISNVRGWWSTLLQGNTQQAGDVFTYRHKDLHMSTQELVEVVPYSKISWLVTDSHLSFLTGKPNEWTGTKINFEIAPDGDNTRLHFVHEGLTPEVECFEACSGGWHFYLQSLAELINTGEGRPDK